MSYTKKDYFEPGSGSSFNSARGDYKSMSFQASSTYTIDKVVLYLESSNSNSETYYVRLYAADGSGLPTGGILATFGTFTITSLQSSYTEEEFDSDSYQVTNGNDYCIVCEADADPNTTWRWFATSSDDYAGGNSGSKAFGFSWIARAYDNWFQLWEEDAAAPTKAENPTPIDTGTDIDFSDLTLSWEDGGGADTYDVYVGDASDNLTLLSSAQVGVSIVLTDVQRALFTDTCWWRIDAINAYGTTTGDDWSFTVAAPGKAQTPTPTDDEENIKITGINKLKRFQWEAPS